MPALGARRSGIARAVERLDMTHMPSQGRGPDTGLVCIALVLRGQPGTFKASLLGCRPHGGRSGRNVVSGLPEKGPKLPAMHSAESGHAWSALFHISLNPITRLLVSSIVTIVLVRLVEPNYSAPVMLSSVNH